MQPKWKFQRDWGFKPKTFHGRGIDILWNNTMYISTMSTDEKAVKKFNVRPQLYKDMQQS